MNRSGWVVVVLGVLAARVAPADEGMWTLNAFPSERFRQRYGEPPSKAWLDRARLASVRLAQGCSGSFVSGDGLVMTNHHCAAGCIQQLSSAENDLMANGFRAERLEDERACPELEVNVLVEIRDVTARIREATRGKAGAEFGAAQRAEMSRIEAECAQGDRWRCDVVNLYHGGRYDLYRYQRYQDVRLVFAPEDRIAFFGGDPDNFTFPRYDLDVAFLRVYEGGKPLKVKEFFKFSPAGPQEGEVVFVTGHPGRTMRLLTVAQVEFLRDVLYPLYLKIFGELRGVLTQFSREGPERARIARNDLFYLENAFKAYNGMHRTLLDRAFMAHKQAEEQDLKARMARDPELAAVVASYDRIATAQDRLKDILAEYWLLEGRGASWSRLLQIARTLVRWQEERAKPNEVRLREFRESALPSLTQSLFSTAPIEPDLEEVKMAFWLSKVREHLGPDHPVTRLVLGRESPEGLARALVRGTGLADVETRKRLWEAGTSGADDPMIAFARRVDQAARAVRKTYEDEVEAVEDQESERLAQARFKVLGSDTYPDATFTLRITYGVVAGYREGDREIAPITTIRGLYERATGQDPYALPPSWEHAKDALDPKTPMNFASTCDIVGGNSGSPVISRRGEVVGLVFDGNIQSLGGAFWFEEPVNRAVAVATPAILQALDKVYRLPRLVRELTR